MPTAKANGEPQPEDDGPSGSRSGEKAPDIDIVIDRSEDASAYRVGIVLMRVLNRVQADRRVAHDYGSGRQLTMLEAQVCSRIAGAPGISAGRLADMLNVTPSAISQVLAKLIDKNQVERGEDPENRRLKPLHLTPEGQTSADAILARYDRMVDAIVEAASAPGDVAVMHRFLSRLERFLSDEAGPIQGR